jgi:hypothetical protein
LQTHPAGGQAKITFQAWLRRCVLDGRRTEIGLGVIDEGQRPAAVRDEAAPATQR